MSPTKRKPDDPISPPPKKSRTKAFPYHLTPQVYEDSGEVRWPARQRQIDKAREIIKECARSQMPTLILPDKDADGISSGVILHHTLSTLGLSPDLISVYFPPKGSNVHDEEARQAITAIAPTFMFVLDQGSRSGPALSDLPHQCLIIDHHFAEDGGFPQGADYVTAHDCPPVATSSLLTYHICLPLDESLSSKVSWLAALGTHGDLGNNFEWQPPFPDMIETFKTYSKSTINKAVSSVNAPRRTGTYNVQDAWDAVLSTSDPSSILKNEKLERARAENSHEVSYWQQAPPKFSADATIAVITISSSAQIHPVIATRWSNTLKSKKLEIVMCANEGYLPDKVNFSCRVANDARARVGEDKIDIIKTLERIVADDKDLRARLGQSFARGHKEASGGIVGKQEWEEFKKIMGIGENVRKKKDDSPKKPVQKNTLNNYFAKKAD